MICRFGNYVQTNASSIVIIYTLGNTDHRGSAMRIIACYTTTVETKIFKTRLDGLLLDQFVPVTALAAAGVVLEIKKISHK